MHRETKTRLSAYYLFSSPGKTWVLTAFSAISLALAVKNLISPSAGLQFDDAKFRTLALVMEGVSAVVLSYWIAKSSNKLERAFIGLWLIGWAMLWFAPVYSDARLVGVRYLNVVVWVVATAVALKIAKAANVVWVGE
jgi:hypothetical protein